MKKSFIFFLIVFLLLLFVIMILVGDKQKDTIQVKSPQPSITASPLELIGWFPAWDSPKAEEVLPQVINRFKTFSPMLYRVMEDGSLGRHQINNWDTIIGTA